MGRQQTKRRISYGKCGLCGGTFSKGVMTRHLASCQEEKVDSETASDKRKREPAKTFHLLVEGRYQPEYWMHLEVQSDEMLRDLDGFLRNTWLECCGHLSAFRIEGGTYISSQSEEIDDESMDFALSKVLRVGTKFYHEYDFGTTTELTLRVLSERKSGFRGKSIRLLARNNPPLIACGSCGKTATQVCTQCIWSGEGWLCDTCADEHACGEEMCLPVVNSPRVGMCGYTG